MYPLSADVGAAVNRHVLYCDGPDGLEDAWRRFRARRRHSHRVWNDAYLAAFALAGGLDVVTFDSGLKIGGFVNFFYEHDSSYFDNGIDDSYWVVEPGQGLVPRTVQGVPSGGDFKTALFDVTQGSESVQWGGLATGGLETENHALALTYLYTRTAEDVATRLTGEIVDWARRMGANCIVTVCPLCQANLDLLGRRGELLDGGKPLPALYFTQLLGLALGCSRAELGLDHGLIPLDLSGLQAAADEVAASTTPPSA